MLSAIVLSLVGGIGFAAFVVGRELIIRPASQAKADSTRFSQLSEEAAGWHAYADSLELRLLQRGCVSLAPILPRESDHEQ